MQYWSLFILGVDIETSTIILDFSSFNLTSETCEAPTVSFLCSRFSYLDVRLLCIALSNSGSAGWVFQICWFVLFFSFFLFLIWQQRLLFLMTIHLDLSQRLCVSNCWFFFSSDTNAPKHFFPTADTLKHFWRHWICRALLSFPFLANPGYNMTVELQFLSTCVSWIWSSATLEMSGVSKLVWITNVFHAHLWRDETIASFLLST